MIPKDKIKKAADIFSLDRLSAITMGENNRMRRYFLAGIRWLYGNMWHRIEDVPHGKGEIILLTLIRGADCDYKRTHTLLVDNLTKEEWSHMTAPLHVRAWAYLDDLLSEELTPKRRAYISSAEHKFGSIEIGDIVSWTDSSGEVWIGRVEGKDSDFRLELFPCISRKDESCDWHRRSNGLDDTWTVCIDDIYQTLKSASDEQADYYDSSILDTFWREINKIDELLKIKSDE